MSKREVNKPITKGNKRVVKNKEEIQKPKPVLKTTGFEQFISNHSFKLSILMVFGIALIVFRDFVFLKDVFFFKDLGSDSINVDYPWMVMYKNMNTEQGFFGWSFYYGMGYPIFSGVLTLINPYLVTNLVTEPIFHLIYGNNPAFLKFPYFLFFIVSIGIISFFYFRTIGVSKFTQIIGSLLIPFMGFLVSCSSWNTYYDVLGGIFLLFSFEQLYKKKRWYFFPIAIVFLTGNIFNVYMYGFFLITYFLFRFFSENNFEIRKLVILSLKIGGLTILGLALNFVNYAPYLINAINSPRVSGDVSLIDEAAQNPLMADTGFQLKTALLRLFSSDMVGTTESFRGWYNYLEAPLFYCGIICLLLIFQAFTYFSKKEKIASGVFVGFWLLVVLIPSLRHTIHLWLGEYYKVGINFFIPFILIFFGMQALTRIEKQGRINPPVLIISVIVFLIVLFFPYQIGDIELVDTKIRNWALFFIIAYGVALYFMAKQKFSSNARIVILVLILFELSLFSNISISSRKVYSAREFKQSEGGYKDNTMPALAFVKSRDKSFYRFEKDYFSGNAMHASLNDAQAQGYFGTTLYSSYNQPYYINFLRAVNIIQPGVETQTRWAPGLRSRPLLQTMASVKYNVSNQEKPFMLNAGYRMLEKFGKVNLMENDYFIPFGYCFNIYITEDDFMQLSNLQKDIVMLRAIVLDKDVAKSDFVTNNLKRLTPGDTVSNFGFDIYKTIVEQCKKDTLQITEFKHDDIKGTIQLDSAKMLFFSIPYDENWKTKVDGKVIEPELANIGFMALPLEKGNHTIELFYTPAYFYIALIVSILATIVYVFLFFVSKEFQMKTKLIGFLGFLIAYAINFFFIF